MLKLRKICSVLLVVTVLLANLCVISFADGTGEIVLEPIVAEGSNIVVEGTVLGNKRVSIFVVPETVGAYTIDSVDSFVNAISEGLLLENLPYASQKTCTSGSFRFAFTITESGQYVVLVGAEDSAAALGTFRVMSFAEQLNTFKDDYAGFKAIVIVDFSKTGAVLTNKYLLLTDSYRELVLKGLHEDIPFEDNDDVSDKSDARIKTVIDDIISSLKAEPVEAKKIIDTMRDMLELFGADYISVYEKNLYDDGRLAVDDALVSGIGKCLTPEAVGKLFDDEVEKQISLIETDIVSGLNDAETIAEFAEAVEAGKEIFGFTDDELKLSERLSDEMLEEIFSSMIAIGDSDNDGKTDFNQFDDIAEAFRDSVEDIAENTLVLDIINNRDNGDEIISIMKEYADNLEGLNLEGYEALGDSEAAVYRKYVREKFLEGEADVSLDKAVERFNSIVENAAALKTLLDKINSQDYSGMTVLLTDDNMLLLGVNSQTKANYKYVKENLDSEYTNLINELIKYLPYDSLESFNAKLSEVSETYAGKIDDDNSPSRTGSSKAGREYVISGETNDGVTTPSKTELFTDIDSVPWAKAQIFALAERGIIYGIGNGLFAPDQYVTREQFVKMLIEAYGLYDANALCDFVDVTEDSWYYGYVASGYEAGIVQGDGNGSFGAGQSITRQDMAVLAYRAYMAVKGDMADIRDVNFTDFSDIALYAHEAVKSLADAGYISGTGDGLFNPYNVCTRAEAAVIIYNMMN